MEKLYNKDTVTVAIHQPGYHRYIGYFYKMLISDIFISLNTVQYVSREWQNRQRFYLNGKFKWLSVPVNVGREPIFVKRVINQRKVKNHWEFLKYLYRKSPYFNQYKNDFQSIYDKNWEYLGGLCDALTQLSRNILDIDTPMFNASSLDLGDKPNLNKADLLIYYINRYLNQSSYSSAIYHPRSGPIPQDFYLNQKFGDSPLKEIEKFSLAGIQIKPYRFSHPKYIQYQHPNVFVENSAIIDMIFNVGSDAKKLLLESNENKITYLNE